MPTELKFAKTHEWVKVDGNLATIGISDFAVHALTDLVYIDLPKVGRPLKAGKSLASWKASRRRAIFILRSPGS